MAKPRFVDPRDSVEECLVGLAERLGAAWHRGPPLDGWVLHRGVWIPVEIKAPEREGLKYEYTAQQQRFFAWCRNRGGRWWVWRTESDVMRDLGAARSA